jgi:heme exporter protein A
MGASTGADVPPHGVVRRNPIEAHGLGKSFGALPVLRGVDLGVAAGETVAVLGPNGAGKSTLLKILAGCMRASAGTLRILGEECHPGRPAPAMLAGIGYLGHDPLVYRDLTPRQNLEFFAGFYARRGSAGDEADRSPPPQQVAARALARAGLAPVAERPTHTLSRGMLQRLALARATLHDPDVLLLDEPFSGLDPAGTSHLEGVLEGRRAAARTTVMISHDLALVPRLASRAVVLWRGGIAADLAPVPPADALASSYRAATGQPPDVGDRS